jgi:hypothetical protein
MLARTSIASFCVCVAVVVLGFSAEAEVRGQLFPQTTENIHLEMVFKRRVQQFLHSNFSR